jgi:hypothetical protein
MDRLTVCLGVGFLSALALMAIRGGYEDAPYVVPVFALAGFLIAYSVGWLLAPERLRRLDGDAAVRPRPALLRDALAAGVAVSCLYWSGRVIQGAGYGGWLVALFLGVAMPLVVCLLSVRQAVLWGLLVATCVAASTLAHHPQFRSGLFERRAWEGFWDRDASEWAAIWAVLAGLSLAVSVPLTVQRARRTRRGI